MQVNQLIKKYLNPLGNCYKSKGEMSSRGAWKLCRESVTTVPLPELATNNTTSQKCRFCHSMYSVRGTECSEISSQTTNFPITFACCDRCNFVTCFCCQLKSNVKTDALFCRYH